MAKRSEKSIYKAMYELMLEEAIYKAMYKKMLIDRILEWSCEYVPDELVIKPIRQLENIFDRCWEKERRSGI